MQEQRARQILQALVQGVDPFNGEELAAGTVLQQGDVLRALLAGVAALEHNSARAEAIRRRRERESMRDSGASVVL